MSEILIKGMALPKPSTHPITLSIYPNGNIYIHHELSAYKAIEVPPHGRLVDADSVKKIIRNEVSSDCDECVGYTCGLIDEMPTVIEASK